MLKPKKYTSTTVIIKPKRGLVYRRKFANTKDAELCISMHEAVGDRACILEQARRERRKD